MVENLIEIIEYKPTLISNLNEQIVEELWSNYKQQIDIEFPSLKSGMKWKLNSKGWIGYILINQTGIVIKTKVPVSNLFLMLIYAYRLKSIKFLDGIMESDSLQGFYEKIADLLALKVSKRCKLGLYKTYENQEDQLPFIRGKFKVSHLVNKPFILNFTCEYQEQTLNNIDNQILTWTLYKILRSGLCTKDDVLLNIKRAYRLLTGYTELKPIHATDCIHRTYNRLNNDYELLHSLCRLFLDEKISLFKKGNYKTVPFLVNMAKLYEMFVTEWLKKHVPNNYEIKAHEKVSFGEGKMVSFDIDIVLYDKVTDSVRAVIDTKYKDSKNPDNSDISQVITYAVSQGCKEAILIYPTDNMNHVDLVIGEIRVRTLAFNIEKDIMESGQQLLKKLIVNPY